MPQARKTTGKKTRCKNCDEVFVKNREWQEFCSPACKKQFWRSGGVSIGRMRPIIAEMITAAIAEATQQFTARIERLERNLR